MKKLLIYCLVAIAITACKKKDEEANISQKLKSVTTTNNSGFNQKVAFSYNKSGHLERADKYENGVLLSYFEYTYNAGLITSAKSYIKSLGSNQYDQLANIKLTYNGNRLTELAVFPIKPGSPVEPTKYLFEYGSGEIPVKFSLALNDGSMIDCSYGDIASSPFSLGQSSAYFEIWNRWRRPGDEPISGPNRQVTYGLEFDDKNNPFYKLPWIDVESMGGDIQYVFSASGYFGKNNPIKTSLSFDGSPLYSYTSTYTYLSTGYPEKSTATHSLNNTKLETIYEYW